MKQIITLFAFFIMMWNANAQTCEIGYSDLDITVGSLSSNTSVNSWNSPTTNQIFGTQRVVNKNGNITAIGFACGNATTIQVGLYSDNSNVPDDLLWNSSTFDPSNSLFVNTFYTVLSTPIPVTAGMKFWPFIRCQTASMYSILANNDTDCGFLKFKQAAGATWPSLQNPIVMQTNQPTVGQWAIWLVIENCVEPIIQTVQAGNASNPSTWLNGAIPIKGDSVVIQHEVTWDIDMETNCQTFAWMLVTDSLTMASESSIQTNVLVDSLGNNFAETVRITNPGNNVSIDGAGTSWFNDLLVDADSLFFEKPVELFNLELESNCHVVTTNLSMEGKENIPSSIYWNDAMVDVTFSGTVPIVDRFSIINPPGNASGAWRIEGGPGTGETIGDWDASPGHTSTGYLDADYPSYNFMSPAVYNETNTSTNKDIGWEYPTGDAHSLDSIGFFAYYNAGSYETSWNPTLVTGTFTFSGLTNTSSGNATADGWHLLRNPFACAVDFEDFILSGVEQRVWTWDHLAVTYDDYDIANNAGTGGRTNEIAAGQAFWVKVLSGQTGTVSIPPSAMVKNSTLQYREGEEGQIELILTAEDNTSYNAFVIPSETGELTFDTNDVLTLNSNSDLGNVTICTTSSDGIHLSQNAVPNNQTIIVDVYGSTPTPNGDNVFTVSVGALYEDWCIAIDWAGGGEEWIPVTNGEELVVPVSIAQSSQTNFAKLRLAPDINFDIEGPEDGIVIWEPGQETAMVTFTATGSFETEYLDWFMNDETTSFGNTEEVTYSFTEPGIYTVSAWSSNTCSLDAEQFVVFIECAPMSLSYASPEVTEITMIPEGTEMIPVEFEISAEGHEMISWEFEDGTILSGSDQTTVVYEFTTFGTHTVLVTVSNDCSSQTLSFTVILEQVISVEELGEGGFSIFPNPCDGNTINLSGISDGKSLVEVYDATGKLIHRSTETILGTVTIAFDNTLPVGVYYVRIDESSTKVVVR